MQPKQHPLKRFPSPLAQSSLRRLFAACCFVNVVVSVCALFGVFCGHQRAVCLSPLIWFHERLTPVAVAQANTTGAPFGAPAVTPAALAQENNASAPALTGVAVAQKHHQLPTISQPPPGTSHSGNGTIAAPTAALMWPPLLAVRVTQRVARVERCRFMPQAELSLPG